MAERCIRAGPMLVCICYANPILLIAWWQTEDEPSDVQWQRCCSPIETQHESLQSCRLSVFTNLAPLQTRILQLWEINTTLLPISFE